MKRLPSLVPESHRRARNALQDLALGRLSFLAICGDFGVGKTHLLEWGLAKFAWEYPLPYHLEQIEDYNRMHKPFDLTEGLRWGEELGLVDDGNRDYAGRLLRNRFLASDQSRVGGLTLVTWLKDVARCLGRPRPDALACLSLVGIIEEPKGRFPVLINSEVGDTLSSQDKKILRSMGLSPPQSSGYTQHAYLTHVLEIIPCMFLFDEADVLDVDVIESARRLADITGTPICLAGGPRLESRLLSDPRLRALMTRVGASIKLGKLTAADVKAALPGLDSKAAIALWKLGQSGNFRVTNLILQSLSRFQEANPGLKVTPRLVTMAAREVLGKHHVDLAELGEDSAGEAPAAAMEIGRKMAVPKRITLQPRKVARAAG